MVNQDVHPDFILKSCQEVEPKEAAFKGVYPKGALWLFLQNQKKKQINEENIKYIKTIQLPTHGELFDFMYQADPNYLGKDWLITLAEYEGKIYKIVTEIHVVVKIDEGDSPSSSCYEPTLLKVKK